MSWGEIQGFPGDLACGCEEGFPIPNSQRTFNPSLAFSRRGPQRLLVLADSLGPTSQRYRSAAPWSCARLLLWPGFLLGFSSSTCPRLPAAGTVRGWTCIPSQATRNRRHNLQGCHLNSCGCSPSFLQVCTTICVMGLVLPPACDREGGSQRRAWGRKLREGSGHCLPI